MHLLKQGGCVSRQLINEYRAELDRLRAVSGSRREGVLSDAFKDLLRRWGKTNDLVFVSQHEIVTKAGNRIYTDGALLHSLRVPFGYWEAKDEDDDLEREIEAKFRKGYPKDNIIFSDDRVAILYQDGARAGEAAMDDTDALLPLLTRFFAHERAEIADFRKAVKQFAVDLPQVLAALRDIIAEKRAASRDFARAEDAFLKHARDAINPAVSEEDVQEMLIQHILTEDIFAKVFENPDFHRQNNVAAALYALERELFGPGEKQKLLKALGPYYAGIQSTAAVIESHSEKQGFLKGLYENFYKVYNPLAADRLGVVYTPGEIVRFMIRSADWLCEQHFGKNLIDKGVEILDPATGTGTFIVELLEHFRGNRQKLAHKYKEELHANEVAILPYYVANLNIEATYAAITGQFAEYPNLCFVDTLDNVAALGIYSGHQGDMFGSVSDENMGRIKRQNDRKISVIIGNPPYNANQQNENDNNKNRTYARVDERIKKTYGARRSSHKTKIYDPFVRFLRWASDRVGDEGNGRGQGVVGFIVNRSFVDKRAFDGFRRSISTEFQAIYVIDLGGDSRDAENAGADVFGNRIGSAILFLVRDPKLTSNSTRIARLLGADPEDRLSALANLSLGSNDFALTPLNELGFWEPDEDASRLSELRLVPAKLSGSAAEKSEKTIFGEALFGFVSNRDDWVIDRVMQNLERKVAHYLDVYKRVMGALPAKLSEPISAYLDYEIKWTEDLRKYAARRKQITYDGSLIRPILYRPYSKRLHYHSNDVNWSLYHLPKFFPNKLSPNPSIYFSDRGSRAPFTALGTDVPAELHLAASTDGFQGVSRYRYTKSGERIDNITD